ncbi:hypothetical protein NLM24_44175, partial [Nocardia zapadnayensis]|nr:hypothetical protein [Nocardia zapadnayensis]
MRTLITIGALMLALMAGIGLWVTDSMSPTDSQSEPIVGNSQDAGAGETEAAEGAEGEAGLDPSESAAPPAGEAERPEFQVERRQPAPERERSGGGGSGSGAP